MLIKLLRNSNSEWFRTTLELGEVDAWLGLCSNCAAHQVRYYAISAPICSWFTAQCNTVQRKKNHLFFLLSKMHFVLAVVFHFSHIRDLCCAFSTASNYNNDMQVHVRRSKGMLIGVLVVSGKSWKTKKTNKKKSTWEVITVTFFSH